MESLIDAWQSFPYVTSCEPIRTRVAADVAMAMFLGNFKFLRGNVAKIAMKILGHIKQKRGKIEKKHGSFMVQIKKKNKKKTWQNCQV